MAKKSKITNSQGDIFNIQEQLKTALCVPAIREAVKAWRAEGCIQYTDTLANIRNYFPDFIAIDENGNRWLIETKGREDIEVKLKDNAAINWCNAATELTGTEWNYLKVLQKDFEGLRPDDFSELLTGLNPPTLFSEFEEEI